MSLPILGVFVLVPMQSTLQILPARGIQENKSGNVQVRTESTLVQLEGNRILQPPVPTRPLLLVLISTPP